MYKKVFTKLFRSSSQYKNFSEEKFWWDELRRWVRWYEGELPTHYGVHAPSEKDKIRSFDTLEKNAAATWTDIYQKKRYAEDLQIPRDKLRNKRILDIGCGPVPSALVYTECEIYGLDHLVAVYRKIGFPIDEYNNQHFHFIQAKSEAIPFESGFFDTIISANAIDHVDDIQKTSKEIQRVLRPDGLFRMHVHYHRPTVTEPLAFNDNIFKSTFSWVKNLRKISSTQTKDLGFTSAPTGEEYVLWGNN